MKSIRHETAKKFKQLWLKNNRRNKVVPCCSPDLMDISAHTETCDKEKMFETAKTDIELKQVSGNGWSDTGQVMEQHQTIGTGTTEKWLKHAESGQSSDEHVNIEIVDAIPEGTEPEEEPDRELSDKELETELQIHEATEALEEYNEKPILDNQATERTMDKEVEYIRYDYQVPYSEEEKPVLGISEDQDEPMDLDEDTPGYSFSVEQNDIQQELNSEMHIGMPTKELSKVCKDEPTIRDGLPANTESYHQNGIGNYEAKVEPTDSDEGPPQYRYSVAHNDQHQELNSEESYVCEPDEKLSQIYTAEPTIPDDLPANRDSYHQNGTGNDEEQPKDHHLNRKCDGGENSDSALSTPNQIPKEIKERKQNKRIRTVLEDEPDPPNKRNKFENCRKSQTSFQGAVKSGTKDKRHRKNKRRQRKIWGSAPSLRNREMHASDCKQHAKDPAICSDAERGKHVRGDNSAAKFKDDPWRLIMWTLSFYVAMGYTFLNSSPAVQCVSIMSVSVTGLCIHYFMIAKSAADTSENPASNPIPVSKKSSVEEFSKTNRTQEKSLVRECKTNQRIPKRQYDPAEYSESKKVKVEEYGVYGTQRRYPNRARKIHFWLLKEISDYIPQDTEEFKRFSNFSGVFLNPAEKSQCKYVLDFLNKFEEKGIISIGNYSELQELKMHNIHHHIINILNNPERFYDAQETALNKCSAKGPFNFCSS